MLALTAVLSNGDVVPVPTYTCSELCLPSVIRLPADTVQLNLVLYGTGLRNFTSATAFLGNNVAEIQYAGAAPGFPCVDQINLRVLNFGPLRGVQRIPIVIDGLSANPVELTFP